MIHIRRVMQRVLRQLFIITNAHAVLQKVQIPIRTETLQDIATQVKPLQIHIRRAMRHVLHQLFTIINVLVVQQKEQMPTQTEAL